MSEDDIEVRSMAKMSDIALVIVMMASQQGGNHIKFEKARLALAVKKTKQKED